MNQLGGGLAGGHGTRSCSGTGSEVVANEGNS